MSTKNQIKTGNFLADGSLINLPIGFIPDYFQMHDVGEGTNPNMVQWFRRQQVNSATGEQEGMLTTGTSGAVTLLADDGGITAFETGSQIPTVTTWTKAVGDAATARSATAAGTYVKPSVANKADRGSIFECVTAGTSAATEPTWPDADGEQVLDGTTVWEKVNVSKQRAGYQGVVIAGALMTDGREMYYLALSGASVDHGDVDGWTDGVDPNA